MTALSQWAVQTGAQGPELMLPDHWRCVDLLSDLHLSAQSPGTVEAFLCHLRHTSADAVLLLGDVFEAWIGDDVLDDADGFEARVCDALHAVSQRVALACLHGNRDFLIGQRFADRTGCLLLPDPILLRGWGQRVLLMHGDALCLDDQAYQAFRREVRQPAWQAAALSRPLIQRRALAAQMRATSQSHQRAAGGPEGYGDLDSSAMLAALEAAQANELVHGHTHRPGTQQLDGQRRRWVLSDWELEPGSTAPRGDLIRFSGDGLVRLSPARA